MTTRDFLQDIWEKYGTITPANVVDEARADDHPMHSRFTWEDSEAAELWRHEEARHLIRAVKVHVETVRDDTPRTVMVRAFPNITTEAGETYVPLSVVLERPDMQQILIVDMRREIGMLERKYEAHAELFRSVLREIAA